MADPKYENLPGIAYDQPDVYECGELPEEDQPEPKEDDDNECIEHTNLSLKDSFNKFKGKSVSEDVNFSDQLGKKNSTGYRADELSLAASGEEETMWERLQRIRCEFSELYEQITALQNTAEDNEKEGIHHLTTVLHNTKQAINELKLDEAETLDPKAKELQEILKSTKKARPNRKKLTATLRMKPEVSLAQSTRLAKLEQRLHHMEAATGVRDEELFRKLLLTTGENTLCSAAVNLASRATMLRPEDLAAAEARLVSLLDGMDSVKEYIHPANPERDARVDELYEMVKKVEGLSHTELIERMKSLEALHNEASNFTKYLTQLDEMQTSIMASVQNNKELLQGVQEVFADQMESITKEIKKLEERVDKVKA